MAHNIASLEMVKKTKNRSLHSLTLAKFNVQKDDNAARRTKQKIE